MVLVHPLRSMKACMNFRSDFFFRRSVGMVLQCDLVVCRRCDFCWIVFDEIASLFSERVSNCTNTLYFGEFSKYSCTPQFYVFPGRSGLLLDSDGVHRFTAVKNTDWLSILRLLPPRIYPHWMVECMP